MSVGRGGGDEGLGVEVVGRLCFAFPVILLGEIKDSKMSLCALYESR